MLRALEINRMYGSAEDPHVHLRYFENGSVVYGVQISITPDFAYSWRVYDRHRTLSATTWVESYDKPHLVVDGAINAVPSGDWEVVFTGRADDPQIVDNLNLFHHFDEAIRSASYFAQLMKEDVAKPLVYQPDPLVIALPDTVPVPPTAPGPPSTRLAVITTFNYVITMLQVVSCTDVLAWPVGTLLCGINMLIPELAKVMQESSLFQRIKVPPKPPQQPPPLPPTNDYIPTPGTPSPFPGPFGCDGCPPNTACQAIRGGDPDRSPSRGPHTPMKRLLTVHASRCQRPTGGLR
jgi:hypothetical protein